MASRWNEGDQVVHPVHGTGRVRGTEQRTIGDVTRTYVVLDLGELTMMIPEEELSDAGLREPIDAERAQQILELLASHPDDDPGRNERRRQNADRLASGDPEQLARVARGLMLVEAQREKGLLPPDERDRSEAIERLAEELSLALDISLEEAVERIERALWTPPEDGGEE